MAFIQNNATPVHAQEWADGLTDPGRQDRVRRYGNVRVCHHPLWTIKDVDGEMRSEPHDLIAPLRDDRLWNDYQRSNWVDAHGREHLDRLPETHLVAQKATRVDRVSLTSREPSEPIVLVRRDQARLQEVCHFCG